MDWVRNTFGCCERCRTPEHASLYSDTGGRADTLISDLKTA